MTIKSAVTTIKTMLGFTYTIDYKGADSWSILEHGIRFESIEQALEWINTHEDALEAYHIETYQD